MADRLNLSIPEELVKQAKMYALEQGKSLSTIVEDFLKQLLKDGSKEIKPEPEKTGISWIDELHGSVKQSDFRPDDEIKWEYLKEKYLK